MRQQKNIMKSLIISYKRVPKMKIINNTYPVWFTKELKDLIIEKKKQHKLYKSFRLKKDYDLFSNLRKACKIKSDECY